MGWGVSVKPPPLFTPGNDLVPIVQEAGWSRGPVWTGVENLVLTGIRSPDRPARSQSQYRLHYSAPTVWRGSCENVSTSYKYIVKYLVLRRVHLYLEYFVAYLMKQEQLTEVGWHNRLLYWLGKGQDFRGNLLSLPVGLRAVCLVQSVQTVPGVHPTSYSSDTGCPSSADQATVTCELITVPRLGRSWVASLLFYLSPCFMHG